VRGTVAKRLRIKAYNGNYSHERDYQLQLHKIVEYKGNQIPVFTVVTTGSRRKYQDLKTQYKRV